MSLRIRRKLQPRTGQAAALVNLTAVFPRTTRGQEAEPLAREALTNAIDAGRWAPAEYLVEYSPTPIGGKTGAFSAGAMASGAGSIGSIKCRIASFCGQSRGCVRSAAERAVDAAGYSQHVGQWKRFSVLATA